MAQGMEVMEHKDALALLPLSEWMPTSSLRSCIDNSFLCFKYRTDEGYVPLQENHEASKPNTLHIKAAGALVMIFPIALFTDDMSGNRSKKWNCHESWLWSPACIPIHEAQRPYNIHFVCTSNRSSSLEIAPALMKELQKSGKEGIQCIHGITNEEILALPRALNVIADNPMHSALCSHIGLTGLLNCRRCTSSRKWATSEDMINSFNPRQFKDRLWHETKDVVCTQLTGMANGDLKKKALLEHQRSTGVKCQLTSILAQMIQDNLINVKDEDFDLEDWINALYSIREFNGHKDTPVEILHAFLLGFVKYAAQLSAAALASSKSKHLAINRIKAFDFTGFVSKLSGNQAINYVGSLVGKDFRNIVQLAV
ncbi:hypothetical protein HK096_008907 [Nowakowskiella sp. JEL0078]|nr:hypothetical protein HK096_008907 [Nowakowskiella sp. JEL0078]